MSSSYERSSLLDDGSPRSGGSGSRRRSSPRSHADHDYHHHGSNVSGGVSKNNDYYGQLPFSSSPGGGGGGGVGRRSSTGINSTVTYRSEYSGAPIDSPGGASSSDFDGRSSSRRSINNGMIRGENRGGKMTSIDRRMEMYAAIARSKSSLMSNHDSNREDDYEDDCDQYDDYEEKEGIESCDYGSRKSSGSARGSSRHSKNGYASASRSHDVDHGGSSNNNYTSNISRRRSRSPSSRSRKSSNSRSNKRQEEQDERSKPVTITANEAWEKVGRSVPPPSRPPYQRQEQNNDAYHGHDNPIEYEYDYDYEDEESQTLPRDMTGHSIGGADLISTVSSMSSTDSYVKKQAFLRELRRAEFEARRRERVERQKQAEINGHHDSDNLTQVVEEEDGDMSYFPDSFCEEDNIRSFKDDDEAYYDDRRRDSPKVDPPASNQTRSSSRYSSSEDAKSRSQRSHAHSNSNKSRSTRSRHSSSNHSSSYYNRSSRDKNTPGDAPPRVQREECCIKHPHIYLSDQTDVNVWTCLRYCKDETTGRWHTKKMVCEECLEEEEEVHHDEPDHHRRFRKDLQGFRSNTKNRLHLDDLRSMGSTTSSTDSYDDDDGPYSVKSAEDNSQAYRNHHRHSHHSSSRHKSRSHHHSSHHDDEDDDDHFDPFHAQEHLERMQNKIRETINVHPSMGDDQTPLEREAEAQKRRFVRRLAARAYHFPGNTWCEDWIQYTSNTHLVFGIFFHHPLHPVTGRERCVILLGSVAVGLLMSNLIYLWFVKEDYGLDDTVISLGPGGNLDVTKVMITMWTLGSFAHTLFDLSIWHIKACTFCRYTSGYYVSDSAIKCGRAAGMTIVMITFAFASYLVLLRASEDYKDSEYFIGNSSKDDVAAEEEEEGESFIHGISLRGASAQHFHFLIGYIVEFILAVFVYNPLILTIVFTGVLGCNGKIPVLGGRPREVMREQLHAMKRQRYTMPQVLKLGDREYYADIPNQKLATNF